MLVDEEGGEVGLAPPALHGVAATPPLVVLDCALRFELLAADCALGRIYCWVPETK